MTDELGLRQARHDQYMASRKLEESRIAELRIMKAHHQRELRDAFGLMRECSICFVEQIVALAVHGWALVVMWWST